MTRRAVIAALVAALAFPVIAYAAGEPIEAGDVVKVALAFGAVLGLFKQLKDIGKVSGRIETKLESIESRVDDHSKEKIPAAHGIAVKASEDARKALETNERLERLLREIRGDVKTMAENQNQLKTDVALLKQSQGHSGYSGPLGGSAT